MIHICVPVLKRYDLLGKLLRSLSASTVRPRMVHIINNGLDALQLDSALNTGDPQFSIDVLTPDEPMGLAASWNWFIQNVPEERFIVNDDIEFAPESLAKMVDAKAPFVSCSFGFSCFLLRDSCVQAVGTFDESLSPGYAYFEDMDYLRRMKLAGIEDDVVFCDVKHLKSGTPNSYSPEEWQAHHVKFLRAQDNYIKKWEANPSWEDLKAIGGAGANQ